MAVLWYERLGFITSITVWLRVRLIAQSNNKTKCHTVTKVFFHMQCDFIINFSYNEGSINNNYRICLFQANISHLLLFFKVRSFIKQSLSFSVHNTYINMNFPVPVLLWGFPVTSASQLRNHQIVLSHPSLSKAEQQVGLHLSDQTLRHLAQRNSKYLPFYIKYRV